MHALGLLSDPDDFGLDSIRLFPVRLITRRKSAIVGENWPTHPQKMRPARKASGAAPIFHGRIRCSDADACATAVLIPTGISNGNKNAVDEDDHLLNERESVNDEEMSFAPKLSS